MVCVGGTPLYVATLHTKKNAYDIIWSDRSWCQNFLVSEWWQFWSRHACWGNKTGRPRPQILMVVWVRVETHLLSPCLSEHWSPLVLPGSLVGDGWGRGWLQCRVLSLGWVCAFCLELWVMFSSYLWVPNMWYGYMNFLWWKRLYIKKGNHTSRSKAF